MINDCGIANECVVKTLCHSPYFCLKELVNKFMYCQFFVFSDFLAFYFEDFM